MLLYRLFARLAYRSQRRFQRGLGRFVSSTVAKVSVDLPDRGRVLSPSPAKIQLCLRLAVPGDRAVQLGIHTEIVRIGHRHLAALQPIPDSSGRDHLPQMFSRVPHQTVRNERPFSPSVREFRPEEHRLQLVLPSLRAPTGRCFDKS